MVSPTQKKYVFDSYTDPLPLKEAHRLAWDFAELVQDDECSIFVVLCDPINKDEVLEKGGEGQ